MGYTDRQGPDAPSGDGITRRQVIKVAGLAALGLAFSKPAIETLRPKPVWGQVSPGPAPGNPAADADPVTKAFSPVQVWGVSNDPAEEPGAPGVQLVKDSNGKISRVLFKYNLSELPGNAIIHSAAIHFTVFSFAATDVSVHALLGDWSAGPLTTFTHPPHDPDAMDVVAITGFAAHSWSIDPALVQSWLTPSSNFGVLFKGVEDGDLYEVTLGPSWALEVTYTA